MEISYKEYQAAFLLEATKLERLMEVIHERLGDHPTAVVQDHFEVFMTGNRCDELTNIEQVLALENSKKHRLERLVIVSSAATEGARRPEYEVLVDFGVVKKQRTATTATPVKLVTVEVRSDAPNWNRQTLSQVEEQVERTRLGQTAPVISLLVLILLLAGFFLVQFPPRLEGGGGSWESSRRLWLNEKELDRIEQAVKENRTLTDAEIREITTGQLRNVLINARPPAEANPTRTRPLLLFGIPFLMLVAVAVYLVVACYPGAVFLWGDELERYNAVLQRRRVLWSVIVGILVVGVLGKLLSEGVLSWIPKT
jgi:hypothetical protein